MMLTFTPVASAFAVELRAVNVRTGTEGLELVPFTISNEGREALACNADIAHWYSIEIANAAPGETARIELWFDPKTGTYAALNDKRENLPVERLWCGLAGRVYATRSQITLDRGQNAVATARKLVCTNASDRLVCR